MRKLVFIFLFILVTISFGVSPSLVTFNSGQVSPLMEQRADFAKYTASCRLMENFFPTIHGSAERRPGTRFIVETDTSQLARLIPFQISTDDSYIIEATANAFRFVKDDGS